MPPREADKLALSLASPAHHVPGIGPATAAGLATLGLTTISRLIAHLPMRHEQQEAEATIAELAPGRLVSARGEVAATRLVRAGRKPRFQAVLTDGTARLDLVWFNQTYLAQRILPGVRLRVQGEAKRFGPGLQLANPSYEILRDDQEPPERLASVRPVYSANSTIDSRQIQRAIAAALPIALPLIVDHLPEAFRAKRNLPSLAEAYRMQHAPATIEETRASRRRLAYDELLFMQLAVAMKRRQLREQGKAPVLRWNQTIDQRIRARVPFALTPAQERVVGEIAQDLASSTPTNRLLQGDVGAGKTVVAAYAALLAVASGKQAALAAPTELLAEQHFRSFETLLRGSSVRLGFLSASLGKPERARTLAKLESGEIDLVIGTHALLRENVRFNDLALAIIDEQHRFGVSQRAKFRDAAGERLPHMLVMTATPIPRTLALSLFGDLDVSTIDELPPGRRPVRTRVVGGSTRDAVYAFVRERLDLGEQAFIVAPAIGERQDEPGSEDPESELELGAMHHALAEGAALGGDEGAPEAGTEAENASREAPPIHTGASVASIMESLQAGALSGKRLAAIHGRLAAPQRDRVMNEFREGAIDALVATTIVEVGVDVPNATIMVVEDADRFGLSQLHQLRGRVGRGKKPGVCVLIASPTTEVGVERLHALEATTDGFALAEKDLELRGMGDVFGLRQSGMPPFRVADLSRDSDLLRLAQQDAQEWIRQSPELSREDEAALRRRVIRTHGAFFGLGDVG
ncbi:MAG: ATP-dependent DNA helicase RecG [Planctomycetota bacterium]|nr:ATP-dependent DNA helicase RecG [Planctomycetota bacterium]